LNHKALKTHLRNVNVENYHTRVIFVGKDLIVGSVCLNICECIQENAHIHVCMKAFNKHLSSAPSAYAYGRTLLCMWYMGLYGRDLSIIFVCIRWIFIFIWYV